MPSREYTQEGHHVISISLCCVGYQLMRRFFFSFATRHSIGYHSIRGDSFFLIGRRGSQAAWSSIPVGNWVDRGVLKPYNEQTNTGSRRGGERAEEGRQRQ